MLVDICKQCNNKLAIQNGVCNICADMIFEAKKYAGFKENIDPNDSEERYYRAQDCRIYDAFIAGVNFANK